MPYYQRPDAKIWYELYGNQKSLPPVVGIMGMAAHAGFWSPDFIKKVSSQHEFMTFDNRACGRSDGVYDRLTMTMMADDAAALVTEVFGSQTPSIAAYQHSRVHIIGVSMGGMIALEFALRYPHLVASLTLCCTTAKPKKFNLDPAQVKPFLDSLRHGGAFSPLLFSRKFIAEHPDHVADFDKRVTEHPVPRAVIWEQIKASWVFDVKERLGEIKVPTLIMTGDADVVVPSIGSKELAQGIPHATLKIFPGSGHGFISENEQEVYALLLPFLQKASVQNL